MNNIDKMSIVKNLIKIAHNHKLSIKFRKNSFELWDKFLNGVQIKQPTQIGDKTLLIEKIFLAIPSLT